MAPRFLASSIGQSLGHDRLTREDLVVDQTIDLGELLGRDGLKVREVEAQAIRLDERACLMCVVAEHALQRGLRAGGWRVWARQMA